MGGLADNIKGKVEEAFGKVSGDKDEEAKGKIDQIVGNVKDKVEEVKDTVGDKVNEALDKVKDKTDNDDK